MSCRTDTPALFSIGYLLVIIIRPYDLGLSFKSKVQDVRKEQSRKNTASSEFRSKALHFEI